MSQTINGATSYLTWGAAEGGVPLLLSNGTYSFVFGPSGLPVEQISTKATIITGETMDASSKQPLTLSDLHSIELTASNAFLAMGKFLRAYFDRTNGQGDLATICSDIEIENDQLSTDPAALSDWRESVTAVLAERGE